VRFEIALFLALVPLAQKYFRPGDRSRRPEFGDFRATQNRSLVEKWTKGDKPGWLSFGDAAGPLASKSRLGRFRVHSPRYAVALWISAPYILTAEWDLFN
jgi:hypothetical protein